MESPSLLTKLTTVSIWDLWILGGFLTAVTIAYLYDRSAAFRYYFKYTVFSIACSITGLLIIPHSLLKPRRAENVIPGTYMLKPISKLLGVTWEFSGKDNLVKDTPYVAICNHQSALDFMVMVELWPTMKKCVSVVKKSLLYAFPFGPASWLCGTIFVDRTNPKDSKAKINAVGETLRNTGTKVWIFPEGTRKKRENLLPFKMGAFHIAIHNKFPIIPVVVSPYSFINDEKKIFNSGKVYVRILPPIDTSNVSPDNMKEFVEKCRTLMNNEFNELKEFVKKEAGKDCVHSFAPDRIDEGRRTK